MVWYGVWRIIMVQRGWTQSMMSRMILIWFPSQISIYNFITQNRQFKIVTTTTTTRRRFSVCGKWNLSLSLSRKFPMPRHPYFHVDMWVTFKEFCQYILHFNWEELRREYICSGCHFLWEFYISHVGNWDYRKSDFWGLDCMTSVLFTFGLWTSFFVCVLMQMMSCT